MANDSRHKIATDISSSAYAANKPHSEPEHHTFAEVYGVTNRPLRNNQWYDAQEDPLPALREEVRLGENSTKYYVADVELTGTAGHYQAVDGPASVYLISKAEFDAEVKHLVTKPGLNQGKLGVYIHGIVNSADDAIKKAAEIGADGHETMVVEDWFTEAEQRTGATALERSIDSGANALMLPSSQWFDYDNAKRSQAMINQSIDQLIDNFHAPNIDLVAHSRGNSILVNYLVHRQTDQSDGGKPAKEQLRSVTFGHGDVNTYEFLDGLPKFGSAARDLNIVYDCGDKALNVSRFTNVVPEAMTLIPQLLVDSNRAPSLQFTNDWVTLGKSVLGDRIGRCKTPGVFAAINHEVPNGSATTHFLQDDKTGGLLRHSLSSHMVGDILRSPSQMARDNVTPIVECFAALPADFHR